VRDSFKLCRGVKSVEVEYIPYREEHGPVGPFGGLTARVTLVLGKFADAQALAKTIQDLGFTVVE